MNTVVTSRIISSASSAATPHATFVPHPGPALLPSLSFTVPLLAGSFARAMALSTASAATISTLTQGFHHLLNGLIDPAAGELTFLQDVETLGDNLRTAFSGFLGAGIADLYMLQLGHGFRCNGRELFRKKGRIFDFAYDGGPLAGSDVVAVEAKGLLRRGASASVTTKAAQRGYLTQIEPHLGTTLGGATVVRGYAIGVGNPLKKGAKCHLHVEETAWGGSRAATSSAPLGSAGPRMVRNQVALRNFRAIFRLMGNRGILDAIDAAIRGQPAVLGSPNLIPRTWRNRDYLVSEPNLLLPPERRAFHSSFGIRADAWSQFSSGLLGSPAPNVLNRESPRELMFEPMDIDRERNFGDDGAEFPDGLAYFGPQPVRPFIQVFVGEYSPKPRKRS
jgi:hypothetical protein